MKHQHDDFSANKKWKSSSRFAAPYRQCNADEKNSNALLGLFDFNLEWVKDAL